MDRSARALLYLNPLRHERPLYLLLLLAMAGCVAAPPGAPPRAATAPAATPSPPGNQPATAAPAAPQAPAPETTAATAAVPAALPSTPTASAPAQTARAGVQAPARTKPPTAAKPAAPAPQLAARPAQQQAPPAAPTLDLAALEQRLRDTRAIGLFTKLSLKNQVDYLLDAFRAHHRGQNGAPLTALRQRYDLLMFKVLTLLQDGDPPLATAINSSREAIWGVLNDPAKLTAI